MQSEPGESSPLLAELDVLLVRLAEVLERLRRARELLAERLAVGLEPLEPAALERLVEETDQLIARGDQLAAVAEKLGEDGDPSSASD